MIVVIVPQERRRWAVAAVHLADQDGASLNSVPLIYNVNRTPTARVVSTFHLVVYSGVQYNSNNIMEYSECSTTTQ